MNEPQESSERESQAVVTSSEEADQLLRSNLPYQSIIFAMDGANDVAKITHVILKYQKTLRSLTLDLGPHLS